MSKPTTTAELYTALDEIHIVIEQSDVDQEWFWHHLDTGEESVATYETWNDAVLAAAASFGVEHVVDVDYDTDAYYGDEMDGDHASALASAGFGTDEDYGGYDYDHFERDWDEPYFGDEG